MNAYAASCCCDPKPEGCFCGNRASIDIFISTSFFVERRWDDSNTVTNNAEAVFGIGGTLKYASNGNSCIFTQQATEAGVYYNYKARSWYIGNPTGYTEINSATAPIDPNWCQGPDHPNSWCASFGGGTLQLLCNANPDPHHCIFAEAPSNGPPETCDRNCIDPGDCKVRLKANWLFHAVWQRTPPPPFIDEFVDWDYTGGLECFLHGSDVCHAGGRDGDAHCFWGPTMPPAPDPGTGYHFLTDCKYPFQRVPGGVPDGTYLDNGYTWEFRNCLSNVTLSNLTFWTE